jgi:hypothetical protein
MDELDDRPLERGPVVAADIAPERKRSGLTSLAVIGIAGLAVGALAAWWWMQTHRAPVTAPAATAGTESSVPIPAEPERILPPLAQMDTFLRALLGSLSSHPDLARWLATDDLIRQMANGIDRIARGQNPARDVPTLRPNGEFQIARRGKVTTIDPASFRRYDNLARLVQSLDPKAVAEAYRTIYPRLDEAYRAQGRSEGHVDGAVTAALQLLIDTPIPNEPVAIIPGQGATFAFADPRYERLTPAQKQLLRMGPDNARRIQTRLREIRDAISTARQ